MHRGDRVLGVLGIGRRLTALRSVLLLLLVSVLLLLLLPDTVLLLLLLVVVLERILLVVMMWIRRCDSPLHLMSGRTATIAQTIVGRLRGAAVPLTSSAKLGFGTATSSSWSSSSALGASHFPFAKLPAIINTFISTFAFLGGIAVVVVSGSAVVGVVVVVGATVTGLPRLRVPALSGQLLLVGFVHGAIAEVDQIGNETKT